MKIKLFENFNESKGWNGIPVTMDKLKELFDADALKDIKELEDQTGVAVEAKNGVEYDVRFNNGEYLMDVIAESASIKRFENFNESDNPLDDDVEIKIEDGDDDDKEELIDGGENIELSQEEIDSMADDEDEEVDEAANPLDVTSKDIMRIKDIVRKAAGDDFKAKSLATTMCKLIKDSYKALRRARAAERENEQDLADIFFKRATELGALGA